MINIKKMITKQEKQSLKQKKCLFGFENRKRMGRIKKYLILIIPIFCSCKERYPKGHYPDNVTNFTAVNSEFDDYNSDIREVFGGFDLCFSTNRHSNGANFDIAEYTVDIVWSQRTGKLNINACERMRNADPPTGIDLVNTENNELGPYSMFMPYSLLFLYASDETGNYDIKYLWNNEISEISFLKTEANEMYPSFYGKDVYFANHNYDLSIQYGNKIEKIIYCSDKDGSFDLYEVNLPNNSNILEVFQSSEPYQSVKLPINSAHDDKCPYVNGSLLVFSSNRPGGFGGFDLYYSIYRDGTWSTPVNFGKGINSEYDEYRPVAHYEYGFDNNLMIFSSNRPGGLGGFDLYYVGISKSIKIK